jgi:hypothetical protein
MEPETYQPPTEGQLAPDYGPPPDWQSWLAYQEPARPNRSRLKTALGGLILAGLLVVGGAATVFAADPTPSPSTSPSVTTPGTTDNGSNGSSGGTSTHNCPKDQSTNGSSEPTTDSGTSGSST